MLTQSAQPCFHRKRNVVLICVHQHCTKKYLCNVYPQPMNNFEQENNLQCRLDLCGPTLRKKITCEMFAHGYQTTFLSKITFAMLCLSRDNMAYRYCLGVIVKYVWDNIAKGKHLHNVAPKIIWWRFHIKTPFTFWRYAHVRYVKVLFKNIQKQ